MVKVTRFDQKDNHKIKLNSCFIQPFCGWEQGVFLVNLQGLPAAVTLLSYCSRFLLQVRHKAPAQCLTGLSMSIGQPLSYTTIMAWRKAILYSLWKKK